MVASVIIAILLLIAAPNFSRKEGYPRFSIVNTLRIIEGAKDQWAQEHHATNGALPTLDDLAPYLKDGKLPKPAAREIYTVNPVGTLATAKLTRKMDGYEAGRVFTVTNFNNF